ncbi:DUF202 domain-containing protein [Catellatospora bangladeshensis]|uniref:DUF202 domain-containing protein n=1 Tax=Catellatospora bangladeshensis TaxID=310355 RepID=A0A8J3JEY5_9ACTN|nr:DUF202 domain-containing protein [Catellatospora bangladeshensis]GIF83717.1 hypothetical protein Cba03nite_50660 [Catellatospora bangladeshensis]
MRGAADPGAQPERTRLAWRRTVLAATACALLLFRLAFERGLDPAGAVGLALGLLCWLAMLTLAHRRIKEMARPRPAGVARLLAAVAVSCIAVALLGVLLILA